MTRIKLTVNSGSRSNLRLGVRNSVYGLSAVLAQLIGTTFSFFVIARIPGLTVADFGVLTYAFSLSQLFAICFEYGLIPYFAKKTAAMAKRNHQFEMMGYGLHLALMGIGFYSYLMILQYFELGEEATSVCKWIGASVFVASSLRFFNTFHQGQEKIHLEFISTLSELLIIISVIGLAFIQSADTLQIAKYFLYGRLVAWVAAYSIFGLANFWIFPKMDYKVWKEILCDAVPFAFTFIIAFAVTNLDTIMLQILSGENAEQQIGLYQAAIKLVLIPTILAMVATKVLLPQFSRMGSQSIGSITANLSQLNNTLCTIGLLSGVFFFYHAGKLVELAYGSAYSEAGQLVQLLAFTMVMRFGAAYNLYFTLNEKMWLRVFFSLTALASAIILNYFLIPIYGVKGVVYSSILTHMIYWVPYLVAMKKLENDAFFGWRWFRALVSGLLLYVLLMSIGESSFIFSSFVCMIYGVLVLYYSIEKGYRSHMIDGFLRKESH